MKLVKTEQRYKKMYLITEVVQNEIKTHVLNIKASK